MFTSIGALLAMVVVVLAAFFGAHATDFRAQTADFCCEFGTAGHETRSGEADLGAIAVKSNAMGHHFNVVFLKACGSAMFAFDRAVITSIDTALEFFVRHKMIPFDMRLGGKMDPFKWVRSPYETAASDLASRNAKVGVVNAEAWRINGNG